MMMLRHWVWMVMALAITAGVAVAQEDDPPIGLDNPDVPPPGVVVKEWEDPSKPIDTVRILEPTMCADVTATPTPLPNGDFQFPLIPCQPVDYMAVYDAPTTPPAAVTSVPKPEEGQVPFKAAVPQQPVMTIEDLEQGAVAAQAPAEDYNSQQMRRLGELDGRQGKGLNMSYADNLAYMQGYTQGRNARMSAPGANGFGGVRGFGR